MLGLAFLSALVSAGEWIDSPYWVVTLQCHRHPECFAASNGSYSVQLSGARRFDDTAKAAEFVGTFTSSLRDKSPTVEQRLERICVAQPGARSGAAAACSGEDIERK